MKAQDIRPLGISQRHLHGPGPSDVYTSVLEVMKQPLVGHLDPEFSRVMEEVGVLLQFVFETENKLTIPISGTGSAGMEAAIFNLIEPGDSVLVCTNGYFGSRMAEVVRRCGGVLQEIKSPWGRIVDVSQVEEAMKNNPAKVVCIVHAETSTGVLQPLAEISQVVHEHGSLLLVDAVTSLGGMSVGVDEQMIDVCYSGTQKCLSCPPGLAPITFSPRAREVVQGRKVPVQSWYLDTNLLMQYWGQARVYHHTAPISMIFALHESLRTIAQEGLAACFLRHRQNHVALVAGLEAMGLELLVAPQYRAPSLTTVVVPDGVDEARVRGNLLQEHHIEIGGGMGDLKGRVWRIGLMGHSSRRHSLKRLLNGLEKALIQENLPVTEGHALEAMDEIYQARNDQELKTHEQFGE